MILLGTCPLSFANEGTSKNFAIEFTLVNGLIVLDAAANSKFGKYILDTGCSFVAIHSDNTKEEFVVESASFALSAYESKIAKFTLGNITQNNLDVVQFDMTVIEQSIGMEIDGVIGTQLLAGYNLMIDYHQNKVYFISDRSSMEMLDLTDVVVSKSVLQKEGNHSFINMQVGDSKLKMLLDSGANISVLDHKYMKDFESFLSVNKNSTLANDYSLPAVKLAGIQLEDLGFIGADLDKFQDDQSYDGILSLSSLNASKVLFDFEQRQLYFFWEQRS